MIDIMQGQVVNVKLPLCLSIEANLPSETRLTLVMVPLVNGKSADDGIIVTDVSRREGRAKIELNEIISGQRGTIYLIATKHGIEIPIREINPIVLHVKSVGEGWKVEAAKSNSRIHILAEIYRREDIVRLRHVDQGIDRSWREHDTNINTELTLDTILNATKEEWKGKTTVQSNQPDKSAVKPPVFQVELPNKNNNVDVVKKQKTRDRSQKNLADNSLPNDLPRMACELLYYSKSSGTSRRIVHIVSLKDGYVWAKTVDGKQVKKFIVHGIREFINIETGEDVLPALLEAAAKYSPLL